jgi:hypothetical protein
MQLWEASVGRTACCFLRANEDSEPKYVLKKIGVEKRSGLKYRSKNKSIANDNQRLPKLSTKSITTNLAA